jgi:hypothetical protein
MENLIKKLVYCVILFLVLSCTNTKKWKNTIIESPDKKQSITIITKGDIRYIMNGRYKEIPEYNYIKLDISKISPIGDQIGICWNIDGYLWRIVNDDSRLIENNLDSTLFDFKKSLEKDKYGAPTFREYLNENCVQISIREERVVPKNGAILTYN